MILKKASFKQKFIPVKYALFLNKEYDTDDTISGVENYFLAIKSNLL